MTQTILITGAAKRVGAALAKAFAADGWRVAVHYNHSAKEAEALVAELGNGAAAFQANLTDESETQALIPRVLDAFGSLDAVIHNASLYQKDGLPDFCWKRAEDHMRIHAFASVTLAKELHMHRTDEDAPASIILLGDGLKAWSHSAAFLSYGLSCSTLEAIPPLLAESMAPRVTINALGCGLTLIDAASSQEQFERIARKTPMQCTSSPEEVIATAKWLIATPSVTGQSIYLSGGQHLPRRISTE